eukprot:SAG31_NODE_3538_length_4145_cov_1.703658_1_plen_41_part_00
MYLARYMSYRTLVLEVLNLVRLLFPIRPGILNLVAYFFKM